MRIESNCQTGEIKYFDDADNEIDPPVLEEGNEPLPADEPAPPAVDTAPEDTAELADYITGSSYNIWPALEDATGTKEDNIETADVVQEAAPRKRSASKRKQS